MRILMGEHTHFDSLFQVGCHHLARGLAQKGHQVTYLSTPLTPLHLANLFTSKRGETLKRLRNWMVGGQAQMPGLYSYVPFSLFPFARLLPFDNSWTAWNNLKLTFPSLRRVVEKRGPFDLFLMGDPRFVPLMKEVGAKKNILRLTDNLLGFETTPRSMEGLIRYGIEHCDSVIVTARPLQKWLEEKFGFRDSVYIPNGVDFEHFNGTPEGELEDLKEIPRPRAVYVGAMEKWFDLDLLASAASACPQVSFLLIGPPRTDLSALRPFKNIHLLGPRPYSLIGRYLKACQVGLIPFRKNELINSVSPIKLYEYMACGLPVVSVEWDELKGLRSPALLSKDKASFIRNLGKAIRRKGSKTSYAQFARENSWGKRVEKILALASGKKS